MPNNTEKEKTYQCPHCKCDLEEINYNCDTTGWEDGTSPIEECEGNTQFGYHEYGESENTDCFNYIYRCPECDEEITIDTIVTLPGEKKEKPKEINEDGKEIEKTKEEKNPLIAKHPHNNTYPDCIICPECKKINIINSTNENKTCECVHCEIIITIKDAECINNK